MPSLPQLWIMPAFGACPHFSNKVEVDFYGYSPWAAIANICLPFGIFYGMHAVSSLLEGGHAVLKPPQRHGRGYSANASTQTLNPRMAVTVPHYHPFPTGLGMQFSQKIPPSSGVLHHNQDTPIHPSLTLGPGATWEGDLSLQPYYIRKWVAPALSRIPALSPSRCCCLGLGTNKPAVCPLSPTSCLSRLI